MFFSKNELLEVSHSPSHEGGVGRGFTQASGISGEQAPIPRVEPQTNSTGAVTAVTAVTAVRNGRSEVSGCRSSCSSCSWNLASSMKGACQVSEKKKTCGIADVRPPKCTSKFLHVWGRYHVWDHRIVVPQIPIHFLNNDPYYQLATQTIRNSEVLFRQGQVQLLRHHLLCPHQTTVAAHNEVVRKQLQGSFNDRLLASEPVFSRWTKL